MPIRMHLAHPTFSAHQPLPVILSTPTLVVLVSLGQVLLQERQVLLDALTALLARRGRSARRSSRSRSGGGLPDGGLLRVKSAQLGGEVRGELGGGRWGRGGVGADGGCGCFLGLFC